MDDIRYEQWVENCSARTCGDAENYTDGRLPDPSAQPLPGGMSNPELYGPRRPFPLVYALVLALCAAACLALGIAAIVSAWAITPQ